MPVYSPPSLPGRYGTDHRSQVCAALTTLGVKPPSIDDWDCAAKDGRLSVTPTPR